MSDISTTVTARIPPALSAPIADRVNAAAADSVAARLRAGDGGLWGAPEVAEVENRLGWLTIADRMLDDLAEVERFASQVRADGFTDVVLLGMGGSSLAPEVLRRSFGAHRGTPLPPRSRLHGCRDDRVGSGAVRLDSYVVHRLIEVRGHDRAALAVRALLVAGRRRVTFHGDHRPRIGPGAALAKEHGFRHTFLGDPNIGGRSSALSPSGSCPLRSSASTSAAC